MDSTEFSVSDPTWLSGASLPDALSLNNPLGNLCGGGDNRLGEGKTSHLSGAYPDPSDLESYPFSDEGGQENNLNFPLNNLASLNTGSPALGSPSAEESSPPDPLTGLNPTQSPTLSSLAATSVGNSATGGPTFAITAEGTVTVNGGGDFDGEPTNLTDDALIHAGAGFTLNGQMVLPVKRDAAGRPLLDSKNQPILIDRAVTVAAGYQVANVSNNNRYSGLLPPQIVPKQTVNVPDFNTLKTTELNRHIPPGTTEVIFKANSKPLNNAAEWNQNFPTPGTASNPKVVKVTGGGLQIPSNVNLNHYVLIVESGDINFNGNGHNLNNVVLVTNKGNINLSNVQATNLTAFASNSLNMNGGARFAQKSLLANGSGNIIFNGATKTIGDADALRVISSGQITYNGASDTRGHFLASGDFTFNGRSTLIGSIGTKKNIIFNGGVTVIGAANPFENSAPVDILLNPNTLAENVPDHTTVGNLSTSDPNPGDLHTYSFVSGTGDQDNGAFTLLGNQLQIKNSPDFETKNNYSLRIRSTDAGGLGIEKIVTVRITNVNEAPTWITLSQNSVAENATGGTEIGKFSTTDPDAGDSHTYSLIDDAGGRFQIVGNRLQVSSTARLDFEANASYPLEVRSTDAGGLSRTELLTIALINVNEAPLITLPSAQSTPENTDLTLNGSSISDVDAKDGELQVNLSAGYGVLTLKQTTGLTFSTGDGQADSHLSFRGTLTRLNQALSSLVYRGNTNFTGNDRISLMVDDRGNTGLGSPLSATGTIDLTVTPDGIFLEEDDFFRRTYQRSLEIPATSSVLSFTYNHLNFDRTDTDSIKDAFEIALVDAGGNSLVHTIGAERDSFFNLTEGQLVELGSGTTLEGQTVLVNLTGLNPGTATLIFRLVNNDSDTQTSVRLSDIQVRAGNGLLPPAVTPETAATRITTPIDFQRLSDVTGSLIPEYRQTSFDEENKILYADLTVRHAGTYVVDAPLLVAVKGLSDPTVGVEEADGITPDGLPYYNLSSVVADGTLEPNERSLIKTIAFSNPQTVQFSYELVFLGQLNTPPSFVTEPDVEALVGKPYVYEARATDVDEDVLSYSLIAAPEGMTIERATGKITWTPGAGTVGNQTVVIGVEDGRGGVDGQTYTLSVIEPPPNRPPIFITTPLVDASVGTPYRYEARANDADGDRLSYSLLDAPAGMVVDGTTGVVTWKPSATQLGLFDVTLGVSDGRGGTAEQIYRVQTQSERGNQAPLITSDPITIAYTTASYSYDVEAIDPDSDPLTYSLVSAPTGMVINADSGQITWSHPTSGQSDVTVQVRDNRGGVDTQSFSLDISALIPGQISGKVYTRDPLPSGTDIPVKALTTADNHFLLYYGSADGGTLTNVGRGDNWQITYTFDFTLKPDDYLYAVAWNDPDGTPRMWLGDFQLPDGVKLLSDDSDWYSMIGSGTNPNLTGYAPVLSTVQGDIARGTWTTPGQAAPNVYGPVWRQYPNFQQISSSAEFLWHDLFEGSTPTDAHYVIFRSAAPVGTYYVSRSQQGLAGQTVYLDGNGNGYRDSGEPYTLTDEGGNYRFTVLEGTYTVAQEPGGGWNQVSPSSRTYAVTLLGGESAVNLDFIDTQTPPHPTLDNQAPFFTSQPTTQIEAGQRLLYRSTAGDPENDALVYDLPLKPEGMVVDPVTGLLSWRPRVDQVGVHQVILRVEDSYGAITLQQFEVTVTPAIAAPTFITTIPDFATTHPKLAQVFQYQFEALEPQGESVTYQLDTAETTASIDPTTGIFSWTPTTLFSNLTPNGAFQFGVSAINESGKKSTVLFQLLPQASAGTQNASPIVTSAPRTLMALGQTYLYTIEATDPDYDPLTYRLKTAPTGMTLDGTGRITWTPGANQLGSHPVAIEVADGRGGVVSQAFTLEVVSTTRPPNTSPSLTSAPLLAATVGQTYSYNPKATDSDNDPFFWSLDEAPTGMVIAPRTGELRWTPTAASVGDHAVKVRVIDSLGAVSTQEFTLSVRGVNLSPKMGSVPITRAVIGQPYVYSVVAADPEGDALTFNLVEKPVGMVIDSRTGQLSWTPKAAQVGSHRVEVQVIDSDGAIGTQTWTVEVGTTIPNQAPSITSTPQFGAAVGSAYTYQMTASDPEGATLTYQLVRGPSGMSIDAATGLLSWANPVLGQHPVLVRVSDGSAEAAQGFTLTAIANHLPLIRSTQPPTTATPGEVYRYEVIATDPDGGRLTYRLDSDSSGKGINIDELGRLSWTPSAAQVGTHPITITLTDGAGASIQQNFTLEVKADALAPQVQVVSSLSSVTLGESVTLIVTATDNIGVKSLILTLNGKAVTLGTNGLYTFTPDKAGQIQALVTAVDAAGNQSTAGTTFNVIDLSEVTAPVIDLPSLSEETFTAPTEIIGTVSDNNLSYYTLSVAPVGTEDFSEIFRGTNRVNNGVLGTFDPSLLENDAYTLRLTAVDDSGNEVTLDETVNVEGELKLGNFQLSFTDLTLPVSGIPITVTRTYDTLTADERDDFGYGWRLEFRDTDLRTSLGRDKIYEQFGILSKGFKAGDKVYITLPGGKREAYTFQPELDRLGGYLLDSNGNGGLWHPKFVSQSGSYNTLTVSDVLLTLTESGQYAGLAGLLYNPIDPYFGGQYTLTTKEGIVYEIEAATGELLAATDTNGNKLTFSDAGIKSNSGVEVRFGRDAQGRITTITDPMNNMIRYEYDAKGDLIKVTDREENSTQFEYNGDRSHYLDKIIDPLNREAVRTEYDEGTGRLRKIVDAERDPIEFDYDRADDIQIIKDAYGNPTTYEYDERGNVIRVIDALGHQTHMEYDSNNNLEKLTDANGLVTEYKYDGRGNLTSRTEQYCGCPTETPGTTYYTYNRYGQTTSVVLPTGASMTMDYDARGNLLSMKDGKGNIIQSFIYDAVGRVTSETDTSGTTYYGEYDRFGNARWMKDALGQITTSTYDDNGQILTLTDKEGTSTFTYDKLGRETFADYGNGIWVDYGYEGSGADWITLDAPTIGHIERKFTDDGKLGGWVTPDGGTPTFYYDQAGRLWRETDAEGNITTEYGYDKAGRLTTIEDVGTGAITTRKYDDGGRLIEEIDALNGFTRSIYDEQTGKLEQTERGQYKIDAATGKLVEDPTVQKQIWQYEYNGTSTTVIDPLGRETTSVSDDYYLPVETIYTTGQKTQVSYLYGNNLQEAKDYPTKIIDIGGNERNFTYDDFGRLESATDLGDGTYNYTYGDDGLELIESPLSQTSEGLKRETLEYSYDGVLGNLEKVTYGDGTFKQMSYRSSDNRLGTITLPSGETVTYDYYDSGQVRTQTSSDDGTVSFTYTPEGAIETMTDGTGTTTYHYDPDTGAFNGIDYPNGSSISYTYDLLGRIETVTEKGSATGTAYVTEYDYDAFGNLNWIEDPAGGVTTMTYDLVNRLEERILPNGVKTTYEYDDLDRVESIVYKNAQGEVLASVTYEREGIGEPTKITREDGSYVELEYDEALRVEKESYYNAAGTLLDETSYTYDAAGKRMAQSTGTGNRTYSYTSGYQLDTISESGEVEDYDYDTNGRLTLIERDGETLDLEHDTGDRLSAVENETTGSTIEYTYDGQGRRIKAVEGTDERRFLVAPAMGSGLESTDLITDGNGNLISNYIYAGGSSPFMRLDENGDPIYYLTDAMGTVIGLADGAGTEVADFRYDSFGNLRGSSGVAANSGSTGGDFRFQGQWLESESGLYYFRARDYDSKTGLFLSRDPVDPSQYEPESFNPYQFVYNNPFVYSDPSGAITLLEINTSINFQDTLRASQQYVINQAKDYFVDQAKGVVGNILQNALKPLLPNMWMTNILNKYIPSDQGNLLSSFIQDQVCGLMKQTVPLYDRIWLEAEVSVEGEPKGNGFGCDNPNGGFFKDDYEHPNPDFIFKKGEIKDTDKNPKAWLIGDIKVSMGTLRTDVVENKNQWQAIYNYANYLNEHQYTPLTFFIVWNNKGAVDGTQAELQKEAVERGVFMYVLRIID